MKAVYTMKFLLYAFVILFTQLSQHKVSGQVSEVAGKSQFILQAIEQYHYQPRLIDDAFSAFLFDDFILSLDE